MIIINDIRRGYRQNTKEYFFDVTYKINDDVFIKRAYPISYTSEEIEADGQRVYAEYLRELELKEINEPITVSDEVINSLQGKEII